MFDWFDVPGLCWPEINGRLSRHREARDREARRERDGRDSEGARMNIQRYRIVLCDDRYIIKEPCDVGPYVLYEDHKYARKQLQKDAAIGRLVRRRLVSGNDILVSWVYVTAQEVNDIDAGEEQ